MSCHMGGDMEGFQPGERQSDFNFEHKAQVVEQRAEETCGWRVFLVFQQEMSCTKTGEVLD